MRQADQLHRLHELLLRQRLSIATAESCTGGQLSAALTSLPNASSYMRGGVVAYQDEVKCHLLSVSAHDLKLYSAVSQEVAEAMALGAQRLFGSDLAIATTGYAGPTAPEGELGLVWIGLYTPRGLTAHALRLNGARTHICQEATREAIRLTLEQLSELE